LTEPSRERRKIATPTVALVTALIALVSSGIGLVFDLFPGMRPDPRTTRSADVAVLAVEPRVPVGDWLERTKTSESDTDADRDAAIRAAGFDPEGASEQEIADALAVAGTVFFVQTNVEGLKRDRVKLRWSIYERRGGRVADPSLHDVEAVNLRLDAPTDRSVVQVWTPEPTTGAGPLFARFELRDENDVALAIADSKPFRGS
jgi:hypothetical protein